jgi:hypothetical protein
MVQSETKNNGVHFIFFRKQGPEIDHSGAKTTRVLRGLERDTAKTELKTKLPSRYATDALQKIRAEPLTKRRYLQGELQKKKSDSALRKVRVEALAENDYAKDDWEEL